MGANESTTLKKLVDTLHKEERIVLKTLAQGGKDSEEICKETGLSPNAVTWAIYSLSQKEMVHVEEKIETRYALGTEGQNYLDNGFPEFRLVKKLQEQIPGREPRFTEEEKKFGVPWALKMGWASVTSDKHDGFLSLTQKGRAVLSSGHPEHALLEKVTSRQAMTTDDLVLLAKLKRRGDIVREKKIKKITASLTNLGSNITKSKIENLPDVNVLSTEIIVSGKWRSMYLRPYNVLAPVRIVYPGKVHPYQLIIDEIREIMIALGFEEVYAPPIELNFWNCDALFMPSDHPARDIHDMFYLKEPCFGKIKDKKLFQKVGNTHAFGGNTGSSGWGTWDPRQSLRLVLRSQTTAVSARYLKSIDPEELPCKMFTIDRNYRPEKADSTHLPEFNQCEGIVAAPGVNFRHIMGYMKRISQAFGIREIKFQPAFFPFTEPSIQGFIKHPTLGWIEALPGGVFRPEVTRPLGLDVPVLAWGIGIDRLAMVSLEINDIRQLFSSNLDWLRDVPLTSLRV